MKHAHTQAPLSHTQQLLAVLDSLPSGTMDDVQPEVLARITAWRKPVLEAARRRFEESGNAEALLVELTEVTDAIIACVFHLLMPNAHGVSVVATGGYGRCEMFPFSDVDLLFIYRSAARVNAERVARYLLYIFWDLNIKVGHALRSVEDTLALAAEDITIRTNLLDARLVVGDAALCACTLERLQTELIASSAEQFVEMKLAERDDRHRKLGDSRYMLEPNIKESKGGLRDLHTVYWIARYVYGITDMHSLVALELLTEEEYQDYLSARNFLWCLRAHLHYVAGKAEERLTFDRQQALAPRMGYKDKAETRAVERLMKRYFNTASGVGNFTRIVCALLEESHKRKPKKPLALRLNILWKLDGFTLDGERLNVKHEDEFARDPLRMLKLFAVAQKHGYDIHPKALQLVSRHLGRVNKTMQNDVKANALFMDILLAPQGPEQTLKRMNDAGMLGKFIPEFGRVVGQMQFNMYHIYTVDEHILVALGVLHAVQQGRLAEDMPLATEVMKDIVSRKVLYFSLLCHDLGKGSGEDQCVEGGRIVAALAARFGFTAAERELAVWLVENHLFFTETAFKRDINDPQTIRDFVAGVQSIERLRLLLCLTVADIRAVGPGVWNAWKATLLRGLYLKTEAFIRTGKLEGRSAADTLRTSLAEVADAAEAENYLALAGAEYLSGLDVPMHVRMVKLLARMEAEHLPVLVDAAQDKARSVTVLTVITQDQHGLFSRLAGGISLSSANIVSAQIFTLKNGLAVDIFHLQDAEGSAITQPERLARMSSRLRQVVEGAIDVTRELSKQKPAYAQRKDAFSMAGQVFIENEASATHTVIEVVGRDRVGFLHAVTQALSEAGVTISSAHISTYGAQAVDVFYVKDVFGLKITHDRKLQELRDALLKAVE